MHDETEGKTAGRNTQSQGGIGREAAQRARRHPDPAAGGPGDPRGGHVPVPGPSLDEGGGDRGVTGFTGDDGGHVPADAQGRPAPLQPGQAAKGGTRGAGRCR
ncbi:hypothetical protein QMK61_15515 [Fulvimonas sp. R45]|uniref:hypothetical protein n=1 Tax=Fulvimonas sp. R45 TaxID=3045937 RepID=UPI00265F059B|nr:hypothetical protein [Fulvimonas sp. R45]MDO1530245.1 hypothetical protein [Fulvimonas sp. R45]